ncbi:MAG TPA: phenylalanine--tRNA ligase beta subunit-related protein [Acidobacteriota bacterium]
MRIGIEAGLRERVRLGVLEIEGIEPGADIPAFDRELDRVAERLRARFGAADPAQDPRVAAVRSLFRSLGIDPTKRRPSSEALLRRILQNKPLSRIHPLVDACNLLSLELLLPIGLYDLDRIEPPVELRLGREGESYAGIGRETIHFAGRGALCDIQGPFGSPISDSERTKVRTETERALWVIFGPAALSSAELQTAIDRCAGFLRPYAGDIEYAQVT